MKRLLILVLSLVLCIVVLAGCGKEPTIDEQLYVGMKYQEVYEIIGFHGTVSEISSDIHIWDTGDEEKLYVFTKGMPNVDSGVTHFERRKDLTISVGMTRPEVNALLHKDGARCHSTANIYTWDFVRNNGLYAWFDSDGVLVKYLISSQP